MRVFIAGATGVLGKRVVPLLLAAGHQVVGLSRSADNARWLQAQGADVATGDLFNPAQVCDLVAGADAVLHLATAIPTKPQATARDWVPNDHIRRDGTKNLIAAALQHGCRLYVQQSVTFLYGQRDGAWVDETAAIPAKQAGMLYSAVDMEKFVQEAVTQRGLPAINLRLGAFYCQDSSQTQTMFKLIKKGYFPTIGDGKVYWNLLHVDDAAGAVVKAVDNYEGNLGGTFNICDNEPVLYRELAEYVAQLLHARKPMQLPVWLARVLLNSSTVEFMLSSVRCRNDLAREKLGWEPQYPTYREGYKAELEKWLQTP